MTFKFALKIVRLLLFAIFYLIAAKSASQTEIAINPEPNTEHDLLLNSVKLDHFSSKGLLTYGLKARAIKQNNSTGTSYLKEPIVEFENPIGTRWSISAKSGTLYKTGSGVILPDDMIHLKQSVKITRSPFSDQRIKVSTENFFLFPSRGHGETLSPVTINSLDTSTTAMNLSVNLKLGKMALESGPNENVETIILVPKINPYRISSQTALISQTTQTIEYEGAVSILQRQFNVKSDKLTIFYNAGKAKELKIQGLPVVYEEKYSHEKHNLTVRSSQMKYQLENDQIQFKGNVQLQKNQDTIIADVLDYNLATKELSANSTNKDEPVTLTLKLKF